MRVRKKGKIKGTILRPKVVCQASKNSKCQGGSFEKEGERG